MGRLSAALGQPIAQAGEFMADMRRDADFNGSERPTIGWVTETE